MRLRRAKSTTRRYFPWQIFSRAILVQSFLILNALAISGIFARSYFKQQFITQMNSQAHETLVALGRDLTLKMPSRNWCAERSRGLSLHLTAVDKNGTILCDSIDPGTAVLGEEIALARQSGSTKSINVVRDDHIYSAVALQNPELVLRGVRSLASLQRMLAVFDRALGAFLTAIAVLLGVFAAWSIRRLVFPIGRLIVRARGAVSGAPSDDEFDEPHFGEWSELESSIDEIRRDLRKKNETLTNEREELTTLMSAISDAVLAVGKDGAPLFFNSRFAVLFLPNAVANNAFCLWEVFREPEILSGFHQAIEQGKSVLVKPTAFEDDVAGRRYFSISIAPLRKPGKDDRGAYGAVLIFHDVTDLKSAEQIRIDFVANVSHELRTPLTAIKGYTETLVADVKSGKPAMPEFLEVIARNSDRLMNLINDLLDLSSLESGDILHKEELNTLDVSQSALKRLESELAAKKQDIKITTNVSVVVADARRLDQVLENLLMNAHKYTPVGSRIEIIWDKQGRDVSLKVKDTGPGIAPEHQKRLFERFYRVDKARSREAGGTGLGLAIVKHILQRHGGSVHVESQLGKGATFVCHFPS